LTSYFSNPRLFGFEFAHNEGRFNKSSFPLFASVQNLLAFENSDGGQTGKIQIWHSFLGTASSGFSANRYVAPYGTAGLVGGAPNYKYSVPMALPDLPNRSPEAQKVLAFSLCRRAAVAKKVKEKTGVPPPSSLRYQADFE